MEPHNSVIDPVLADIIKTLLWLLVTGMLAGIAWLANKIIKPWSDAYLARSKAFVQHVESMTPVVPQMLEVLSSLRQLVEHTMGRNTVATDANTAQQIKTAAAMEKVSTSVEKFIDALGSDPMRLCALRNAAERFADAMNERGVKITVEEAIEFLQRERNRSNKG